jgi:hypothetical protein
LESAEDKISLVDNENRCTTKPPHHVPDKLDTWNMFNILVTLEASQNPISWLTTDIQLMSVTLFLEELFQDVSPEMSLVFWHNSYWTPTSFPSQSHMCMRLTVKLQHNQLLLPRQQQSEKFHQDSPQSELWLCLNWQPMLVVSLTTKRPHLPKDQERRPPIVLVQTQSNFIDYPCLFWDKYWE